MSAFIKKDKERYEITFYQEFLVLTKVILLQKELSISELIAKLYLYLKTVLTILSHLLIPDYSVKLL